MELIKGEKAINQAIMGLGKRLNNVDEDMQRIAVSAIFHALDNSNNWEVVSRLVKVACGYDEATNKFKSRSIRSANFRQWVVKHLPIKWEYRNECGRFKTDEKKMAVFNAEKCKVDIMLPWYVDVKDANEGYKGFDLEEKIKALVKTVNKEQQKVGELSEDDQAKFKMQVSDDVIRQLLSLCNFEAIIE